MLGLPRRAWEELRGACAAVVHCAGRVNLVEGYGELEGVNVGGVARALEFAAAAGARAHVASTLSVFVATERDAGVALESDDLSRTRRVWGGYAQTKFVAEELVRSASARAPCSTYRLGLLTGDTATGECAPADFLMRFVAALEARGEAPEVRALALDVTPVDWAARVMAELIVRGAPGTYHVSSGARFTLEEIVGAIREGGGEVGWVSPAAWARGARAGDAPLAALALCRACDPARFGAQRALDLFQGTGVEFDTARAREVVGARWREVDTRGLLARYLSATRRR
jgi:thioester reductase-like protein